MNKLKSLVNNCSYNDVLTCLVFIYLSFVYFPFAFSNIVLILVSALFVVGVLSKKLKIKKGIFFRNYFLISIPFLLTLLSILLSEDKETGMSYVEFRLHILLIPFVFLTIIKNKEQFKSVSLFFIVFSIMALLTSLYKLFEINPIFFSLNIDLSKQATIIQHPYFGIYQLLALIFLLEFYYKKLNKIWFYLVFISLSLGVIISTSRIAYLLYLLVITIYFGRFYSIKRTILFFSIISIALATLVYTNESLQDKFTRSFKYETSPRLKIWNNSLLVLKNSEHPIFGVGIGDYYAQKDDAYWLRGRINKLKDKYKGLKGYDSHNQYIEFLLLNGVLGFIYFFLMVYTFYKAVGTRDVFLISLILIIAIFSFTETILNRQYGIILYSFLMPIILGLASVKESKRT